MTKRKLFLIIVLFLTILTGFRFLWVWASPHAIQPQLVKGVLDLRNKVLNQDKLLTLKGQWEFYPNTLLPTFNKETLNKAPPKNIYKSRISGTMPFIIAKSLLLATAPIGYGFL